MRRIRIPEIAKLAGVTVGTVDRALHGRKGISEETRARILEIAQTLGYRPNMAARMLAAGRTPIRIGVCLPREIHYYFDQLQRGIEAHAEMAELMGIETVWRRPERLGAGETECVNELLAGSPAVLILAPGNPQTLAPLIEEAEASNVRVICVDTDAPGTKRSSVVAVDPEASGRVAAELLGMMSPDGARVAVVTGMLTTEDHCKKTRAFADAFPHFCRDGGVPEVVEAHEDEEEAFQKCFALLDRHPDLSGIYVSTVNCLPVCRAVGARGLAGRIKLVTTDLFAEMRTYLDRGLIRASVYSDPHAQGEIAMRLAVNYAVLETPLPETHYLAPQVVMRSSFPLFREMRPEEPMPSRPAPAR